MTEDTENPDLHPCTEVPPKGTRRRFTREYKERILREADAAAESGGVGALLRREGLYSAHLAYWRGQLRREGAEGLEPKRRGPKPRFTEQEKQNHKLARENARLRKKLAIAEALVDLQKKTFSILASLEPEKESDS